MIFVLLVTAAYYWFPVKKYQWTVLLAASYLFYLWASWSVAAFILLTTITVYVAALAMHKNIGQTKETVASHKADWDREQKKLYKEEMKKKRRWVLVLTLVLNLGILGFLKYLT